MFNLLYQLIIVSSLAAGWQRGNSLLILTFLSPSCSLKTQHLMLNPANQSWLWQPDIHSFFFFHSSEERGSYQAKETRELKYSLNFQANYQWLKHLTVFFTVQFIKKTATV